MPEDQSAENARLRELVESLTRDKVAILEQQIEALQKDKAALQKDKAKQIEVLQNQLEALQKDKAKLEKQVEEYHELRPKYVLLESKVKGVINRVNNYNRIK